MLSYRKLDERRLPAREPASNTRRILAAHGHTFSRLLRWIYAR